MVNVRAKDSVVMFVLVLVVVGVARGDMDKVGNAERNAKTFFHIFLPNLRNPLFH